MKRQTETSVAAENRFIGCETWQKRFRSHLGAVDEESNVFRVKEQNKWQRLLCNMGGTTELERAFVPYHRCDMAGSFLFYINERGLKYNGMDRFK